MEIAVILRSLVRQHKGLSTRCHLYPHALGNNWDPEINFEAPRD